MKKPYVSKSKYNQRIDREMKIIDLSSKVGIVMLFLMFPLGYFGTFIMPAEVIGLLAFYYIACIYFIWQQDFNMAKYPIGIIVWTVSCFLLKWILSPVDSDTIPLVGEFFVILAVAPLFLCTIFVMFLPLVGALFGAFKKGQGQNYIDHGDDGGGGE